MASKFLEDIKYEIGVRLANYTARRAELVGAAEELPKLDALIAEAEAELAAFRVRVPDKEKDRLEGVPVERELEASKAEIAAP